MGPISAFAWIRMIWTLWSLTLLAAVSCAVAQPEPIIIHSDTTSWAAKTAHIEIATELPDFATIDDVLRGDFEARFETPDHAVPSLQGYDKTVWGRLRLENASGMDKALSVVIKYPQLDRIDWYVVSEAGEISHQAGGQFVRLEQDRLASRFPIVSTELAANTSRDVYFRIRSDTVLILPIRVYSTAAWMSWSTMEVLIFGLLIGCLVTMAILGLVSFAGVRRWSSLWFAVFCLASAGYILTATGIDKAYLWPQRTGDYLFLLFVFQGLAMAATALFVTQFLNTKRHAPKLHLVLQAQTGLALLTCLTTPIPMGLAILAFSLSLTVGPIAILAGIVLLWRKRVKGAGLVVLSWIPNQLSAFWIFLRAAELVPYSEINHFALPVFCTLTAIAFIWALHRQNAESEYRAVHDTLTGLLNRFGFEEAIDQSQSARHRPLAIMQIDLDGFKSVNDSYGHAAGDFVLQEVARRLRHLCLPEATPFRTGGDEFVVLCQTRTRREDVSALAQRIISSLSEPVSWRGEQLIIGASVGISFPLEGPDQIKTALEEADAALYRAKQNGKGCVMVANDNQISPLAVGKPQLRVVETG
ncbi:MAG: diguanylate cyclase domain-containing protein [Henriciella sp.]